MHHTTTYPDSLLNLMREAQDPLADRVISDLIAREGPEAARAAFDKLITQLDLPTEELPPSVQDFLEASTEWPDWADASLIRQAETVFLDYGPYFMLFLYFKSLPILYSCSHGAQVLLMTGRLMEERDEYERFARRIAETAFFLMEVMSREGLKAPHGRGLRAIRRVRLIHAAVRSFIPADRWDDAWGKPINQEDLCITLMTFSISMLDAMAQMKKPLSEAEEKAYFHHWRLIGHLLGVHPDMLPADAQTGRILLHRILQRQMAPSEAGYRLTAALIEFGHRYVPKFSRNMPDILIRHLAGKEVAETLGVKNTLGCLRVLTPAAFRKAIRWAERVEDLGRPLAPLFEEISLKMMYGFVKVFDGYKGQAFEMPEEMRMAWGMENV